MSGQDSRDSTPPGTPAGNSVARLNVRQRFSLVTATVSAIAIVAPQVFPALAIVRELLPKPVIGIIAAIFLCSIACVTSDKGARIVLGIFAVLVTYAAYVSIGTPAKVAQKHEEHFDAEGLNSTIKKDPTRSDTQLICAEGGCMFREASSQREETFAVPDVHTLIFDMRHAHSTPGNGHYVIDANEKPRELLFRAREFANPPAASEAGAAKKRDRRGPVSRVCYEAEEYFVDVATGKPMHHPLLSQTCVFVDRRPDRILVRSSYDGKTWKLDVTLSCDVSGDWVDFVKTVIPSVPVLIPQPRKILALVSNLHQRPDDQKPFKALVPLNGWQNGDTFLQAAK